MFCGVWLLCVHTRGESTYRDLLLQCPFPSPTAALSVPLFGSNPSPFCFLSTAPVCLQRPTCCLRSPSCCCWKLNAETQL